MDLISPIAFSHPACVISSFIYYILVSFYKLKMEAPKERKPFTVIEALSTDKARVAGHVKWFDKVKV